MIKGKFIDNLPKVYGIYTGGFIAFILLMSIGEHDSLLSRKISPIILIIGYCILIPISILKNFKK